MRLLRPPPASADPIQRRAALIVYYSMWIVTALAVAFFVFEVCYLPRTLFRGLLAIGIVAGSGLVVLWLNQRGQVRVASLLHLISLWALFSGLAATAGGVMSPIAAGYLVLIFLAGFLLGARAAWIAAAVSGLTTLALVAAAGRGLLPPSAVQHSPLSYWAVLALFMLIVLGLQHIAARDTAARLESEADLRRLSRVVEQTADSVIITDREGLIEYVNPAFERQTGYPFAEAVGQTPRLLKSGQHEAAFHERLWNTILSGEVFRGVIVNRKKDGTLFYEEKTITPLRDERGRITHFVATAKDVTEHRLAEEALRHAHDDLEQRVHSRTLELNRTNYALIGEVAERAAAEGRLRAFAAALPDTAFIVDVEERFEEVLTATSPLPGIAPAALQGHPLSELLPPELAEAFHHVIRRVLETGASQSIEYALPGGAADTRWFEGRAAPLLLGGGGRKLVVFVVRDITARKRAEEALRQKTEELDRFFNVTLDLLCIADTDGYFRRVNTAWERMLGYTCAGLMGARFLDLVHPDDLAETLKAMAKLADQQEVIDFVNRYRCKDGSYRWVEWRSVPADNLIYASARDITEQKRAEETLRKLSRAVEQSPTSIVITDRDARIEYVNAKFTELTGYAPGEVLGRNPRVLNSGQTPRETYRQMWAAILAGLEWRGEFHNRKKNGGLYWEEAVISSLKNSAGEITHFIAVKEDITARKQAGQKLKAVLGELERSNRDLEQFAYIASHDLQEPLRLVASFVQLLGQRYRGRLDANADQFIGFAVDGAQRMQTLIQDLLAYSRVGREIRPFVPVDCGAIMAQVVQTLSLAIREQQATVACDPLPTVPGDPTQLGQLFQNLVANALKFRRADPPQVRVSAVLTDDKQAWQFAIRDNGIGIDAEFYERIFVIFQRLHGRSKYPGSGIGLSICKKIVELHGGRIWVDSVKDRGTVFSFTLPRTPIA